MTTTDETHDQSGKTPEGLGRAAKGVMEKLGCEIWEETRIFPLENICAEHDSVAWDDELNACGFAVYVAYAALAAAGVAPPAPSAEVRCSGAGDCPAKEHEHGCFAERIAPSAARQKLIAEARRLGQRDWCLSVPDIAKDALNACADALAAPAPVGDNDRAMQIAQTIARAHAFTTATAVSIAEVAMKLAAPVDGAKLAEVIQNAEDGELCKNGWSREPGAGQHRAAQAVREYLDSLRGEGR